jgi:hypothetical protein
MKLISPAVAAVAFLLTTSMSGSNPRPGNGQPASPEDEDLWVVSATITETVTRSGSFHSSFTTKVTPTELIPYSQITIEKNNHLRSTRTASAFVSAVVPNEGAPPVLVIYEAKPISFRVAGSLHEEWQESRIETINGMTVEYSSETEDGSFDVHLSNGSIQAEFSDENKGVSVETYGEGQELISRRRFEKGEWKTLEPSQGKRSANFGFGASEDQAGSVTRRGDTIYVNKTESKTSEEDSSFYGKITVVVRRTISATLRPLSKEPPQADPGGPYEIERGAFLSLDGSRSKGNLISYQWKFSPARGCPSDVQLVEGPKEGPTVEVVLLCPVMATLTVSDGKESSSRSVTINVKPREWKTPFEHVQAEGSLSPATPPLIDPHLMAFSGGANVCSLDPSQDENHSFHPGEANGTWDESGYQLGQVADPGGPFDKTWYVQEYKLRISRQTLMNPYLLPGGKPPLTGIDPWYDFNKRKGAPVDAYLKAIRDHEMEHSNRKRAALPANDPAVKMEPIFGNDRDKLKEDLDRIIHDAEFAVCEASKDPLPRTWAGTLWFPKIDTGIYMQGEVEVGGPLQIETPPCKK